MADSVAVLTRAPSTMRSSQYSASVIASPAATS
jgi:hypothetical protein